MLLLLARLLHKTHRNCTIIARSSTTTVDLYASIWPRTTRFNTRREYSSLATAFAQQCSTCYGRDGTIAGYPIASRSIDWPKVRCVSFDQKTKGDRATVRKFSTGQPWFSSSNSSNVRYLSCCHIVRPAAWIGSWLYQTYLLRLTTSYSIICCPNWWRRTRIFCPGKRQNLAPAMQLNRRYSWRYRKVKFMCAISFFIIIIILKTQGHPTMISP